jgi:predicted PurR-regulated permease PerM
VNDDFSVIRKLLSQDLMQVYVRLFLLLAIVWFCVETFAPFLPLLLWSVILAVSLYPLNAWLAARLRLSEGKAAIVFVLCGFLIIGVPLVTLGISLADHADEWALLLTDQQFTVPVADPAVAEWPVIGPALFEVWDRAHEDLVSAVKQMQPQLIAGGKVVFGAVANTVLTLLLFLVALVLAGFMMGNASQGEHQMRRVLGTIADHERGEELHALVVATVRSVSNGGVGVAFLQALALGIGFLALDIPGASVLAFAVLLIGVVQLPGSLVVIPVIAWLWLAGDGSLASNVVGSVYLFLAGMADNVLKPILLGRGVETPMPIVLVGALGGLAAEGLIGLFVGAVMLSVGYKLLMAWVEHSVAEHEGRET